MMKDYSDMTLEELRAEINKGQEEERREDARSVASGHPFKVVWWHHRNGDDIRKAIYFSINPSNNLKVPQKHLRAYIKKTGSAMAKGILKIKRESRGDFKVINLV